MELNPYFVAPQKPEADHKYMVGTCKGQSFFTDGAILGKVTERCPAFIQNALKKAEEQRMAGIHISMDGDIQRLMDIYPDCQALWPTSDGFKSIRLSVYTRIGFESILRLMQADNADNFIYVDQAKLAALIYLCGIKKRQIERVSFKGEGGLCPIVVLFNNQEIGVIMPVNVVGKRVRLEKGQ